MSYSSIILLFPCLCKAPTISRGAEDTRDTRRGDFGHGIVIAIYRVQVARRVDSDTDRVATGSRPRGNAECQSLAGTT